MHNKLGVRDLLTSADLAADLAHALKQQHRRIAANEWRDRAVSDYKKVIDQPDLGPPGMANGVAAFWKVQRLLQVHDHFSTALQLSQTQEHTWRGASLLEPKFHAYHGTIHLILGKFSDARSYLRRAVDELEKQNPLNLNELPRALNNCAAAELGGDDSAGAELLCKKTLALYEKYRLADDLVLIETYNVLGACSAQVGEYARAIGYFREGLARCDKLGEETDSARSKLLLNVALLHKSQGDLDEALEYCKQARAVFKRIADPEDRGFAAFDAALANLYIAKGKEKEAYELADSILQVCARYDDHTSPLVVTAKHCQALKALSNRETIRAAQIWTEILALQEQHKQTVLIPRTLNYLGLTAELERKRDVAEAFYQRARSLQENNTRAFPVTHFITKWRLGELLDQKGKLAEAKELLKGAVDLVEETRVHTFGDSAQRAAYFAQFAPAFDRLVEWYVRDGDTQAALIMAMRSRSRTLLDQLQLARVDPAQGAQGPNRSKLIEGERDSRKRISALRAKAQAKSTKDIDADQAKRLLEELDAAQRD